MNLESLKQASAEAVERIAKQDEIGKLAAAAPFPGPLREAFAVAQGIKVGPFTVRAFCDGDFEFLEALDHPLSKMYRDALRGIDTASMFIPSGPEMWVAAWLMTHDPDEADAMLSDPDGVKEIRLASKKEFSRLQMRALGELFKAIMRQVDNASTTVVQFEAVDGGEGEEAKAKSNPTFPLHQKTG